MIAETLAGIALVKSAVDGIKSAIGTANDIGEIASHIDRLFEGEQQIQKQKIQKSNSTFSVGNVARETIDAKLAQEQMYEMSLLIDYRFGHGTWAGIIAERARRIQEAKEAELEQRRILIRKRKARMETLTAGTIGVSIVGVIVLLISAVFKFR